MFGLDLGGCPERFNVACSEEPEAFFDNGTRGTFEGTFVGMENDGIKCKEECPEGLGGEKMGLGGRNSWGQVIRVRGLEVELHEPAAEMVSGVVEVMADGGIGWAIEGGPVLVRFHVKIVEEFQGRFPLCWVC